MCRYHGPRYKTATLTVDVTDNNDYIYEHKSLDLYIDGKAPLSSHARSMNEGFENNNSELRWYKGKLWVFTLWALEEGTELFGGYSLPYWRDKGDKETLEKTERYYKACQEQLDKEKPLGTKEEDNWERTRKRKTMKGRGNCKTKTQGKAQEETTETMTSSIDTEMNALRELFDCNVIDSDGIVKRGGRKGPEDHDNHCG